MSPESKWREIRISGDLHVKSYQRKRGGHRGNFEETPTEEIVIEQFVDGHNVDFIKLPGILKFNSALKRTYIMANMKSASWSVTS